MSSTRSVCFGRIVFINRFTGIFEIQQENSSTRFLSGRDCSSVVNGTNGNTVLAGSRPKRLYHIRKGQTVAFEAEGLFAISWAPVRKYRSAEKVHDGKKMARAKIGRKRYVGSPSKVRRLVRRLAPRGEVKIVIFERRLKKKTDK